MTAALDALVAAIVLGLVHIVLASHASSLQRGYRWTASARDAPATPLTGMAGRLERASANYGETFAFFATAVVLTHVAGRETAVTGWAAWTYVVARAAYLIAYASGVFLLRSLIWNVATLAIIVILPFTALLQRTGGG